MQTHMTTTANQRREEQAISLIRARALTAAAAARLSFWAICLPSVGNFVHVGVTKGLRMMNGNTVTRRKFERGLKASIEK